LRLSQQLQQQPLQTQEEGQQNNDLRQPPPQWYPVQDQQDDDGMNYSDSGSRRAVPPSTSFDQETAESQQQLSSLDQIRPPLDDTTARVYGALGSVMPRSKSEQVKIEKEEYIRPMEWY
jgi:hypothetical protein